MTLSTDVQRLEPGQIVTLYTLDAEAIGAEVYHFHSHGVAAIDMGSEPSLLLDFTAGRQMEPEGLYQLRDISRELDSARGVIAWQGNRYEPWPLEASGFEMSGSRNPSPSLKMGNVGGFITALCLEFDDMVGAKLTRRRTLAKYLDGMPDADPDEEFPPEIWFIEQKVGETSEAVEFELASAMDFQGVQLPRRQIIANHCPWRYRSAECGYTGPPVADEYDIITTDAARDKCGKRLQSCKLRFGVNGSLPYGGFPAAALTR